MATGAAALAGRALTWGRSDKLRGCRALISCRQAARVAGAAWLAGTVEFAGFAAPPDWRRSRMLLRQAQDMFPGIAREIGDERISMWMGFRPSMPDSLPVIGPSRRHR